MVDLAKVLLQLRAELENIDSAIASLEKLQESAKRRHKVAEFAEEAPKKAGRPTRKPRGTPSSEQS